MDLTYLCPSSPSSPSRVAASRIRDREREPISTSQEPACRSRMADWLANWLRSNAHRPSSTRRPRRPRRPPSASSVLLPLLLPQHLELTGRRPTVIVAALRRHYDVPGRAGARLDTKVVSAASSIPLPNPRPPRHRRPGWLPTQQNGQSPPRGHHPLKGLQTGSTQGVSAPLPQSPRLPLRCAAWLAHDSWWLSMAVHGLRGGWPAMDHGVATSNKAACLSPAYILVCMDGCVHAAQSHRSVRKKYLAYQQTTSFSQPAKPSYIPSCYSPPAHGTLRRPGSVPRELRCCADDGSTD